MIELEDFGSVFIRALEVVDSDQPQEKPQYSPGIGPHTEAAIIRLIIQHLANNDERFHQAAPKRYPYRRTTCDLVIPGQWAMEFKLARLFGDNRKPAENG